MKAGINALAIGGLSFLAVAISNAAGPNKETRAVAGFEAIEVGGNIDLQVLQGPAFFVEVESPDGSATDVLTEVRNGKLRVHYDRSWFPYFFTWGRNRHTVQVTLPKLVALTASGGSNVSSQGTVTGDRLELTASGGADVTLDVAVASLDVRTSGGADLRLTGSARETSMRSSGGSDLDASRLTTETAHLSSSGGSDIWIGASGTLDANASGGSHISYSGEPRSLNAHTSGGGGVGRRSLPR
jgi:hypothetical protein